MAGTGSDPKREELLRELDAFAAIQAEHAEALATGKLQGLASWWQERQRAFDRLRQTDLAWLASENRWGADFVATIAAKVQALVEGERELARLAACQRGALETKMSLARRGKKTLQGYSLYRATPRAPTCVSSRM